MFDVEKSALLLGMQYSEGCSYYYYYPNMAKEIVLER
jgi:hypothetical protein